MPWPSFALRAIKQTGTTRSITGAAVILPLLISLPFLPVVAWNVAAFMALLMVCGGALAAVWITARMTTRPVLAVCVDPQGNPHLTMESWWRSDEAGWPDSWRWSTGSGRLLVIDAGRLCGVITPMDLMAAVSGVPLQGAGS